MTFDEVKEAMMAQIFAKFTDEEMAEICSTENCKRRFRELGWSKPVSTISEELFAKKAFLEELSCITDELNLKYERKTDKILTVVRQRRDAELAAERQRQDEVTVAAKGTLWKWLMTAPITVEVEASVGNPTLSEILFIVDKSGSMKDQREDVVAGFNKLLAEQRMLPGEAVVSTVFFNTEDLCFHNRVALSEVQEIELSDYEPDGGTALLDAIGKSIGTVLNAQMETPPEQRPARTLVVIVTDGEENASRCFTQPEVKAIVDLLQKRLGWQFLYFGANVDHFGEARNLGISEADARYFDFDEFDEFICDLGDACCSFRSPSGLREVFMQSEEEAKAMAKLDGKLA